jgi:putative FmdB family regulatory protein
MMPTYEYECENCACRFELKRRFDEDAGNSCCPRCQGKGRRLFSPSLILYKGSGFYITDSQSDRNRPSEEGKTGKAEGEKIEEGKADKVKDGKKEGGKADKVDDGKKAGGKADKVDDGKKAESK